MAETLKREDFADYLRQLATAQRPNVRAELEHIADEVQAMCEDADDEDATRTRMAQLLTGTANALKGAPAELHSHSWHDLPEIAARMASAPSWAFVLAAIIKENDRAWHAAQMFPQIMEEARVTRSGMVEALSAMRWAAKRGMPLPTEEEIAAQAALIEADKVRG